MYKQDEDCIETKLDIYKWEKFISQTDKRKIIYINDNYKLAKIETLVLVSTGITHYLAYYNLYGYPPQMFDTLAEAILHIKTETIRIEKEIKNKWKI